MKAASWKPALTYAQKVAWVLFLVALPVTSFPYFPPAIGGGALVRPLSVYPLLVLLAIVTLPRLLTKPVPKAFLSLIPFVLVAIGSSAISLLRGTDPALGISVSERVLRALITLGVGGAIYLTVALLPRSLEDLRFHLRWIYVGFGLALIWGSIQAVYVVHFTPAWYQWVDKLQSYISIRRLIHNRISGLTYEPNWFAEQITFLLLPWLLASVLSGYTVFRWRWRWLTVEWILLGWSIALLPFTYSRAGVVNLAVLVVLSVVVFRYRASRKTTHKVSLTKRLTRGLIEVGLVIAIVSGLIFLAGTKNEFFARLWVYWVEKSHPTVPGYLKYLGFSARFTYSETAFRTYEAYPFLGVGLGNYAFYFEDMLPERPLAETPEVLRLITPDAGRNRLITAKNFYLRLLAETGLVGTAAFVAFIIAIFGCALYLWLSPEQELIFWGTGGMFGLVAFTLSGFSFDSFAIPNMWVVFGLITAAAWIFHTSPQPDYSPKNSEKLVPPKQ